MIGTENTGWRDARQKCAAHGADLVKITSGDENDFITSSGAKYAEGKYRLWIGLHRDCDKKLKWTDGTTSRRYLIPTLPLPLCLSASLPLCLSASLPLCLSP